VADGDLLAQPVRTDELTGVLVLCIPLSQIGTDTGLNQLFTDRRIRIMEGNNRRDYLRDPRGFNSAIILVSDSGQLLFPDVAGVGQSIPMIDQLKQSMIPGLYNVARNVMQGKETFAVLPAGKQRYLALTSKVDSAWSLILLLNDRGLIAEVNAIGRVQALVGLVTLVLALAIIAIRSRSLSRPLSAAGSALQHISTGDFDVALPPASDDEIGGLLRNVQITANRLKCYLGEVTSFAITQKQIDTAKAIQRDFLLSELPSSPAYDVAAFSRPALDIGADWYDMVDVGDYAVLLVADVCDKGVPSALYMSVFRSLIRSKLLEHRTDLEAPATATDAIRAAIEQTNNYMASNQNASMMFATVFIAAVNKVTGAVDYLCAGHESPVLMRAGEVQMLDRVSGPAIGLFAGTSYVSSSLQLQQGDTLVIYSDGLVDARDPANEGWGHQRLLDLLVNVQPDSSEALLNAIVSVVDEYMDGSDQFDDLTVMVFKWLGA
jgi:sigma-B regulation protein RsbU (phosphoserine phosphatase)